MVFTKMINEAAQDGKMYRRRRRWAKKVQKALQEHLKQRDDSAEWKQREQKLHAVLLRIQAPLWDILERRVD